jgi:hypothetical protein
MVITCISWTSPDDDRAIPKVTTDVVDSASPPGAGRTTEMMMSEFRVPSERLFNPRGYLHPQQGPLYYLGNDLLVYKVGERINPFWIASAG